MPYAAAEHENAGHGASTWMAENGSNTALSDPRLEKCRVQEPSPSVLVTEPKFSQVALDL